MVPNFWAAYHQLAQLSSLQRRHIWRHHLLSLHSLLPPLPACKAIGHKMMAGWLAPASSESAVCLRAPIKSYNFEHQWEPDVTQMSPGNSHSYLHLDLVLEKSFKCHRLRVHTSWFEHSLTWFSTPHTLSSSWRPLTHGAQPHPSYSWFFFSQTLLF